MDLLNWTDMFSVLQYVYLTVNTKLTLHRHVYLCLKSFPVGLKMWGIFDDHLLSLDTEKKTDIFLNRVSFGLNKTDNSTSLWTIVYKYKNTSSRTNEKPKSKITATIGNPREQYFYAMKKSCAGLLTFPFVAMMLVSEILSSAAKLAEPSICHT